MPWAAGDSSSNSGRAAASPRRGRLQASACSPRPSVREKPAAGRVWASDHLSAFFVPGASITNSSLTFKMRFATSSRTDSVIE